jgi:hypothetical protein
LPINISLDVPYLLLVLSYFEVEGLDLGVAVDYILLLIADTLLVALPQVLNFGEEVILQLLDLNPFECQLIQCLYLGTLLSYHLLLDGPDLVPELLETHLSLAFDFTF